jgi:hypothetical protein
MGLSLSLKAASRSATREFLNNFWNLKVYYRFQKKPPLVPILSQFDPLHTDLSFSFKIHFNIIFPTMCKSSSWSLNLRLYHQTSIRIRLFSLHATCPVHLVLLDLIIITILGEVYKLRRSSLCSFLQTPMAETHANFM